LATWALGYRALSRNLATPEAAPVHTEGKLPRAYLRAWLIIFLGVSVEWSAGFWAAEYLKGLPGGSVGLAAAGAGVFQLAAVLSRTVSSRLTGRFGERTLLVAAVLLMAAGFPLYWTLTGPVAAFTGLALLGMGASMFYPMGLSLAIGAGGAQTAKASSFATAASGGAILVAPLLLGSLADHLNLASALLAIPLLLVVILGLLLTAKKG
jgi:fucose permease